MTGERDIDYDAIEARLTDPDATLRPPEQVLTGDGAATYGRDLLLREYGSDDAITTAMRRGRPSLGANKQGPSPVVRGAIPREEYEAFQELERISGKGQAELVRRAVHDLLVAEKLVG